MVLSRINFTSYSNFTQLHFTTLSFGLTPFKFGGTRWCSWLRHCATSRKVAGSVPDGVTGIFNYHNPSGRTMALGSTQPLKEMSTRIISLGGKGGRCAGLTTLPPSCADCLEIWEPQPSGTLRACPGLLWDCSTFYHLNFLSFHFTSHHYISPHFTSLYL